ncbi:hypothetical protein ACOMHN_025978 [Nucella lapillus]
MREKVRFVKDSELLTSEVQVDISTDKTGHSVLGDCGSIGLSLAVNVDVSRSSRESRKNSCRLKSVRPRVHSTPARANRSVATTRQALRLSLSTATQQQFSSLVANTTVIFHNTHLLPMDDAVCSTAPSDCKLVFWKVAVVTPVVTVVTGPSRHYMRVIGGSAGVHSWSDDSLDVGVCLFPTVATDQVFVAADADAVVYRAVGAW